MLLLMRLGEAMPLHDVEFGPNPPDFVFHSQDGTIGVELTDLDPKRFESGGHVRRKEFRSFEAEVARKTSAEDSFDWGRYTLRESLGALEARLTEKQVKASRWCGSFPERWLLMHVADGSPFGEVVASKTSMQVQTAPGLESEGTDYLAKVTHCIHRICQRASPFSYVILFSEGDFLAFPTGLVGRHRLPEPSDDVLEHGASAPECLLDWKRGHKTIIRQCQIDFACPGGRRPAKPQESSPRPRPLD